MKKNFRLTAILCIFALLILSLSACTFIPGADGADGANGLSAYEIAVRNGFSGTEQEWLESLSAGNTTIYVEKTTNNYNVTTTSGNLTVAANIGLKSIVSVYCSFKKTVTTGGWFGPSQSQETEYTMAGAGVFYQVEADGSAFVVTNYHVVYDADSNTSNKISSDIKLLLYGMESAEYIIPAKFVGGSMNYDLAVLRVDANEIVKAEVEKGTLTAVEFADSDNVTVGQTSMAIGNPAAEGISVTSGIISVDSEYITMTAVDNSTQVTMRVMRTDTAVNSGNSGGALFDATGKLIGIVNAKMNTETAENIAYAIPCNLVKSVVENIIYNCYNTSCQTVLRPMFGVTTQVCALSRVLTDEGLLQKVETVKIVDVAEGSIAYGILKVDDIIQSVTVGGVSKTVTRTYHLTDSLLTAHVGDTVQLTVLRAGEPLTVTVTITQSCLLAY